MDHLAKYPDFKKFLDVSGYRLDLMTKDEVLRFHTLLKNIQILSTTDIECLSSICDEGPLHDGDVLSKTSRDNLVRLNFVTKVVVKGNEGMNACTSLGFKAKSLIKEGIFNCVIPDIETITRAAFVGFLRHQEHIQHHPV